MSAEKERRKGDEYIYSAWDNEGTSPGASLNWWLAFRGYNDFLRATVSCSSAAGGFAMEAEYHVSKFYNLDPGDVFMSVAGIPVWKADAAARLHFVGIAQDFFAKDIKIEKVNWTLGQRFDTSTGALRPAPTPLLPPESRWGWKQTPQGN